MEQTGSEGASKTQAPGNVRITFDYDIRTGLTDTNFLDPGCVTIPAGDAPIILEVKWDAYLPSIIRDAVQTPGCRVGAFSKYAQERLGIAGGGFATCILVATAAALISTVSRV